MVTDTQKELEKIFISYNRVVELLKLLNIKTKHGNEITQMDLRKAVVVMDKKHPYCRWKCSKPKKNKGYILTEGFYWLIEVFFQNEKSLIDADVIFFEKRIKMYEDFLNTSPFLFFEKDMYVSELPEYFNKAPGTIKNNIIKMNKATNNKYKYLENGKVKISKEGIEWLAKNCFKQKYLELLEIYKMDLTHQYINAGYPYDIF